MTDREKAIVTAYTGITMLAGEKFSIFHKYIEDLLGRPVWTHELASESVWAEIKEKSKDDFIELCKTEDMQAWNKRLCENKRVKINSPSSRFDGETGTIDRVYYAIRMDSLVKKKEDDPNFKGSTMYTIISSNVEATDNE